MRPIAVVHADWATAAAKRVLAHAELRSGRYAVSRPRLVGSLDAFRRQLVEWARERRAVLAGFDFPIGVPSWYARRAALTSFLEALPQLGTGRWERFYTPAATWTEIALERPFYPRRPGGAKHRHLLRGLGATRIDDLRRRCERAYPGRRAACPLFWTLGANQVGKAAITGWRDVLAPVLAAAGSAVAVWPFDGPLDELLDERSLVIVETYPAEAYAHVGVSFAGARKSHADARARNAAALLGWGRRAAVDLDAIEADVRRGFRSDDEFDAVVGLLGMLDVVLGRRAPGEPRGDRDVVRHEGWILGQRP